MRRWTILAFAIVLSGCATITKGTTQSVAIDTPGVPGATCTITTQSGPQTVSTPGTVVLAKGSTALPIQCTKECYLMGSSIIPSNTEAMAAARRPRREAPDRRAGSLVLRRDWSTVGGICVRDYLWTARFSETSSHAP